ncbi:MAG: hypothetical protein GF331_07200 [Chitinivibrionales bacterium]|nr:hypothetical protein [Chitinivibrionales bacterium]
MTGRPLAAVLMAAMLTPVTGRGVDPLPGPMHESALESIDKVYREDFDGALEAARGIIRSYPSHPAGDFFCAAALDAWMAHYRSNSREDEFYRYCNAAVEKAEELADRGKESPWSIFFMGGAEGLKANYEMRYERWITAFRYGWKGVTVLRKLREKHDEMYDISYGIGTYLYWRSAMAQVLRWLPGVKDEREEGLALLRSARAKGVYTKTASAAGLMQAMLNEGMFDSALVICEDMLRRYPQSLLFEQGRGRALHGLARYAEAEAVFRRILFRVETEEFENKYNAVMARYWLAKTAYRLGRYASCIAECEGMRGYALEHELERRLDDHFREARELQENAQRRHTSAPVQ